MADPERRIVASPVEARAQDDGKRLAGYAARFSSETVIAGLFREVIAPGAFAEALPKSDVRALWNHDANQLPLGRTSSGTLTLTEDERGLAYVVTLPDTTLARDLYTSVERGDVKESSFAFTVAEDSWEYPKVPHALPVRTITRFEEIFDVSPVVYPAYATTTVSARAEAAAKQELEPPVEAPPPQDGLDEIRCRGCRRLLGRGTSDPIAARKRMEIKCKCGELNVLIGRV